jgi:hypothetical protein
MGWYGADVTPWIFYENFIELMVTIDAGNGCPQGMRRADLPDAGEWLDQCKGWPGTRFPIAR